MHPSGIEPASFAYRAKALPLSYGCVWIGIDRPAFALAAYGAAAFARFAVSYSVACRAVAREASEDWCVTGDLNSDWMRSERIVSAVGLVARNAPIAVNEESEMVLQARDRTCDLSFTRGLLCH